MVLSDSGRGEGRLAVLATSCTSARRSQSSHRLPAGRAALEAGFPCGVEEPGGPDPADLPAAGGEALPAQDVHRACSPAQPGAAGQGRSGPIDGQL